MLTLDLAFAEKLRTSLKSVFYIYYPTYTTKPTFFRLCALVFPEHFLYGFCINQVVLCFLL